MTMVSTGEISLGGSATSGGLNRSVNLELGRSATATINMNESAVRTLAGVPSGAISMSNFYGKSNEFAFTISSNQTNLDLRTAAINAGWNQSTRVLATINSGVTVVSGSTGSAAMTISGSFPNGVTLVNNGTILGRGGNGGNGGSYIGNQGISAGTSGGLALSVSTAVSINNGSGRIAGGGGGGGGGSYNSTPIGKGQGAQSSGGGGGGGIGNGSGGTGGPFQQFAYGGRNGTAGTLTTNGTGGAGGTDRGYSAAAGGNGGSWGAAGAAGGNSTGSGGGGGAAGAAITGNANITWIAFGTRNGGIS